VAYLTAFLYAAGSFVCHQIPERSFHIAGAQLPVCARCTGLYAGGLIGVIAWLARTRSPLAPVAARRALVIAALPTVLTVATTTLGWWDPGNVTRAMLALPLGLAVGAILAAVFTRELR
jgi:uncharacterized membrane protein